MGLDTHLFYNIGVKRDGFPKNGVLLKVTIGRHTLGSLNPPFPQGMSASSIMDAYVDAFPAPIVVCPPKKKRSPEERKAMKEKRIVQSERASVQHVETALSKYNRANNTTVMPLFLLSVSLYLIVTCRLNIKFKNCPFALFSV